MSPKCCTQPGLTGAEGNTEGGQSTYDTHETVKAPNCWTLPACCATSVAAAVLHTPIPAITETCSHARKVPQCFDPASIASPMISDVVSLTG